MRLSCASHTRAVTATYPTTAANSRNFRAAKGASARQLGAAHEECVDLARALAALADRPHHERLAAAHVAGGEDLRHGGRVAAGAFGGRLHVAARVLGHAELVDHAFMHRMHIAHREEHELGGNGELRAGHFLHCPRALVVLHPLDVAGGGALPLSAPALQTPWVPPASPLPPLPFGPPGAHP